MYEREAKLVKPDDLISPPPSGQERPLATFPGWSSDFVLC